ncbi:MAG: alkane 1-monooxygenase [Actinomycetota bacterium]|nr:alkane 1-monooxygenase [Actinomycetota bacterium]MDQ2957097.1 alkane 1-monooxygenase [Actinomycetota bacterium]
MTDVELPVPGWTDRKRYLWLLGTVVPILPLAAWGLVNGTGLAAFWWFGPMFVYLLMPTVDLLLGKDAENPPESALAWLQQDRYYRWCIYAFLPLQYAGLAWSCWILSRGGMDLLDKIGLMTTMGMVAGIGINTAHELGHKKEQHERWFAKIALAPVAYGHFFIEHNRGHHVRVATPQDPASSKLGQSFWHFLPRSVLGSLRSGWSLEARRLRRLDKPTIHLRNDILNAWLMTLALFTALVAGFGIGVLPYLIGQAAIGITLLEVINYVEHYGLLRQLEPNGRYERVRPAHSWNSNNIATNVFLYHLQRHSDHHANPTRRFQALRHADDAPQMPTGYAGMVVLAYFSPLWRRLIDPMVLAHYRGDWSLANVHEPARRRLLRRFGEPVRVEAGQAA